MKINAKLTAPEFLRYHSVSACHLREKTHKTKKIKDLADGLVHNKENYPKDATMVGNGFTITYEMLDNLSKKPTKKKRGGWASRFGFSKN